MKFIRIQEIGTASKLRELNIKITAKTFMEVINNKTNTKEGMDKHASRRFKRGW